MRKIDEITQDLAENEDAISKIEARLEKSAADAEDSKRAYSEALLKDLPPEELSPFRDELARRQADHDGLVGVKAMLEGVRVEAEKENALTLLYDGDVKEFHNSSAAYIDAVSTLESEASELQNLVDRVSGAISGMFRSLEKATSSLNWVDGKLPAEFNLESFLAGELVPADGEDRESILEAAGNDLKGKIGQFEIPGLPLTELSDLLDRMETWRRRVLNISSGTKLIRNTSQLAPPQKNSKVNVDNETLRAERGMLPKEAT